LRYFPFIVSHPVVVTVVVYCGNGQAVTKADQHFSCLQSPENCISCLPFPRHNSCWRNSFLSSHILYPPPTAYQHTNISFHPSSEQKTVCIAESEPLRESAPATNLVQLYLKTLLKIK
jgi:hypothetical protein